MVPAARIPSYGVTLVALFVIASGIALLQVAANPYVAVIGPPETSSSRLNLVQAFNSIGTMLAPLFGGYLILEPVDRVGHGGGAARADPGERMADAQAVQLPYLIVARACWSCSRWSSRAPACPRIGEATAARQPRSASTISLWQPPQPGLRRAGDLHLPDRRDRRRQPVHQLRRPARHRQHDPRARPRDYLVPAVGRDDGRPLRRARSSCAHPRPRRCSPRSASARSS